MSNISLNEQETTIHFMRTEGYATIYTTDRTSMTKLDRLCRQSPENYQLLNENAIDNEVCGNIDLQIRALFLLGVRKRRYLRVKEKQSWIG